MIPEEKRFCYSCETVALRENFVDRPESYNPFSVKRCIFLEHGLGIFLHFHTQPDPKQGIKKFLYEFTFYFPTFTNFTKFDFPLPCDQTLRSLNIIWQMISEKFKCGTFKAALDDVKYL
jgi:hypothetical protein